MNVNLLSGKCKSVAHADIITFDTDLVGPDGSPVKLTFECKWGQGDAWLYDLETNGKPSISPAKKGRKLVGSH